MRLFFIFAMFCLIAAFPAIAQEWAPDAYGGREYNCDVIDRMIADFGEETYVLRGDEPFTIGERLFQLATGCGSAAPSDSDLMFRDRIRSWPFIYFDEDTYQCELVKEIVAAYGAFGFHRRDKDDVMSVFAYHQKKAPYCLPRYVVATKDIHLRDCVDETCELGLYMLRGEALPVISIASEAEDDWYVVAREFKHYLDVEPHDERAFVNAADVAPGPAGFVNLDGSYYLTHEDTNPLCRIYPLRSDREIPFLHMKVIKADEAYREMQVELTAPLRDSPARIKSETEATFADSGEPFIHQLYDARDFGFNTGIFTIDLLLDGITYRLGFDAREMGAYQFHFYCK